MTEATHVRWEDVPEERLTELLSRKLVTGDRAMLGMVTLERGCIVPKHSHDNEQFTIILEGALRFWLGESGEDERVVRAGEVLHIPSGLPHKAEAIERTLDLDVFCPPRQDWLDGSDVYLRGGTDT